MDVGDRVVTVDGDLGTVRYAGAVPHWPVTALGIEWDDPARGRHDGSVAGTRYFATRHPTGGSLLKADSSKLCRTRRTFGEALVAHYRGGGGAEVRFGAKVTESLGFARWNAMQADFANLAVVSLARQNIVEAGAVAPWALQLARVRHLDLGYNLWRDLGEVWRVVDALALEELTLNGNRFARALGGGRPCLSLRRLHLVGTHLDVALVAAVVAKFPNLEELSLGANAYTDEAVAAMTLPALQTLDLSFNALTRVPAARCRRLVASDNRISQPPLETLAARVLDLRHNAVADWDTAEAIAQRAPQLQELRINGNPLFLHMLPDEMTINLAARLGITKLNGVALTADEIANAELYFVAQVALGRYQAPDTPRWRRLAAKHAVAAAAAAAPLPALTPLAAKLLPLTVVTDRLRFTRTFLRTNTVLRLRGVVARSLGVAPQRLRLYIRIAGGARVDFDDNFATLDSLPVRPGHEIHAEPAF